MLDRAGNVREDAYIHIPLLPEDARYADIQGQRLKEILLEIDAISLADRASGNLFWGRNVGTLGHEATQDWVEGYFRASGLEDVHRQPFDLGPQWSLESWDVAFATDETTFRLESARPPQGASSIPPGGLELELVWVGGGSQADYLGRDVEGKAVLVHDIPRPGTLRHTLRAEGTVARAYQNGAAAVGIVYGISDNFAVWQRNRRGARFQRRLRGRHAATRHARTRPTGDGRVAGRERDGSGAHGGQRVGHAAGYDR